MGGVASTPPSLYVRGLIDTLNEAKKLSSKRVYLGVYSGFNFSRYFLLILFLSFI